MTQRVRRHTLSILVVFGLLAPLFAGISPVQASVAGDDSPSPYFEASEPEEYQEYQENPTAASMLASADTSGFQAGNIIGDAVFFDKNAMSVSQIQAFLQSQVPTCSTQATQPCLKDFRQTTYDRSNPAQCLDYQGAADETAAQIIYKVSQACGINPRVILVTLQKEQSLITSTRPTARMYQIAMGYGCPDTAPCESRYYGFYNQVYMAAYQFKQYARSTGYKHRPNTTVNVLYHPRSSCDSSPVYIQNQATANLYNYTPYQPNAAALAAGKGQATGPGADCASYGNRNFYVLFTEWFGSTQYGSFAQTPTPYIWGTPRPGQVVEAIYGTWEPRPVTLEFQWLRNGVAVPGANETKYQITAADAGASLSVRVTASRTNYITEFRTSTAVTVQPITVHRVAGAERISTAVEVSRSAFPGTAQVAYIATGVGFADALAAAPAAIKQNGPLLLTDGPGLPDSVRSELLRLNVAEVVLVGGIGVVNQQVEADIRAAIPSAKITRLDGAHRFETANLAVAHAFSSATSAYLATGIDYPDALAASAAAGNKQIPVILVNGRAKSVPAETMSLIQSLGIQHLTIAGGTGVVSQEIENQLRAAGITVHRATGSERIATSIAINQHAFPSGAQHIHFAYAEGYADALAGSILAAKQGGPLYLMTKNCLYPAVADAMSNQVTNVTILGGPGVMQDAVADLQRCK